MPDSSTAPSQDVDHRRRWYRALHWQIAIGLLVGALAGALLNALRAPIGDVAHGHPAKAFALVDAVGAIFLRLLKMIVVPLIMASIISGIGSLKRGSLGRLALRTIAWYVLTTALAVGAGLAVVNLVHPGAGLTPESVTGAEAPAEIAMHRGAGLGAALLQVLLDIVPDNLGTAVVQFHMLQIVFVSLFLGAVALRAGEAADPFFRFFESLNAVAFQAVDLIIRLAPIAVAALIAKELWQFSFSRLGALGGYFACVILGLALHGLVTLPLLIRLFARRSPWEYLGQMREALALAFSTASSGATLPVTIRCQVERGGIRQQIASFVTPLGATVNMDGTALYEAVAAIFLANVYLVHPLDATQQLVVFVTAVLAAVGAAAIPHAGLVMMVVVLSAVGIPLEGIGLILAVDRVLDMCRTTINVWGDCACAAVIDQQTGR